MPRRARRIETAALLLPCLTLTLESCPFAFLAAFGTLWPAPLAARLLAAGALEVAACVAFAVSWLVKGRSLGPVAGAETATD